MILYALPRQLMICIKDYLDLGCVGFQTQAIQLVSVASTFE